MRGSTFLLRSSSSDSWNAEKISFFFCHPFLSLSLSFFLSLCLFASFSHFSPVFFPLFLPFVCSPFHFLFIFSHFLISFFSFIFSFLFLLWIASTEWSQKWETSSQLPPLPLVIFTFFLIFFISLYFPNVTYGSMLAIYPNLLQHMAIMPFSST